MHPNPVFHTADSPANIAFARDRGFGVLAVSDETGAPLLSHVPFLLSKDGAIADLHLVRSNPITRITKSPRPVRVAISGPDGYVSPDWYGLEDQVPTWNYVAVHLTGILEMRPQEELRDLLDRETAFFEKRLLPKTPWRADKMDGEALDRMMRMIVPFRMRVDAVDGTWKLNQNKPDAARLGAAQHMEAFGIGSETALLAALMRGTDGQG
ncbi:FMN-binding negative transcriptional regulator [Sedimentitalea todarodis]|uniref:FMN-binding negative transcriptional regulator n=1 Tax=Sedimentitalea todarodis TaxID=1631240 RepID=A0ABU3VDC3_9RHOB|nr:FMN-binding negative transcriptional regulator [Sedimentitalea todarodis]MDU9004174.1 FMN-binding negative transcriptional regulator [Sedimentitalea todarodis]